MSSIIKKAENHILQLMNEKLKTDFIYHNFSHTQFVVKHIIEIAEGENLSKEDTEIVVLAGWFHDTGYTIDVKKHENHSIAIAKIFFEEQNYPIEKAEKVYDAILGTIQNQPPTNYLQQIVSDADLSHLASSNYTEIAEILKTEFETTCNLYFTKIEWLEENRKVFKNHKFYTKYSNVNWTTQKNRNLLELNKALKKSLKNEETENRSDKSVDTLFRLTIRNHITYSYIADRKANILLSVNAIVISITMSKILPKLDNPDNAFLIIPFIVFIVFSTISIFLSVMVTKPKITSGEFTKEDLDNKKVNLLFFGNFYKMKLDEFELALKVMMNDQDYLYSAMTKDLYFLGQVLNRKYRLLRMNYLVFTIGIVVSIIAFTFSCYIR
tara:strand:+ start:21620 stop:22765 length:1146 start_codon:yes stop_codon:yes gene_type:complete